MLIYQYFELNLNFCVSAMTGKQFNEDIGTVGEMELQWRLVLLGFYVDIGAGDSRLLSPTVTDSKDY